MVSKRSRRPIDQQSRLTLASDTTGVSHVATVHCISTVVAQQCLLLQADKQPDFMQARVTEGLLAVPAFQQRLWTAAHPGVQQPLGAVACSACRQHPMRCACRYVWCRPQ